MSDPKSKILKELQDEQAKIVEINQLNNLNQAIDNLIESDPDFLKSIVGDDNPDALDEAAKPYELES